MLGGVLEDDLQELHQFEANAMEEDARREHRRLRRQQVYRERINMDLPLIEDFR